jgi:hypothetical protein
VLPDEQPHQSAEEERTLTMPEFIPPKCYALSWNDTVAPYVDPVTRQAADGLDLGAAMLIALSEPVTVTDTRTGQIVWIGSEPTRGRL